MSRFFNLAQRRRRLEPREKLQIHYSEFGVLRIGPRLGSDLRQPNDGCIAAAVIHEDAVARPHAGNRPQGLRILDSIPNRLVLPFQLVDGVRIWIGFCQEVVHCECLQSYCTFCCLSRVLATMSPEMLPWPALRIPAEVLIGLQVRGPS